ncbi:hypothetical protein K501DRAFT_223489, partial [Backusella circina FSU 941]
MAQQKDQFIDPTGRLAESTLRIQDLHQVEKKLVLLIETAGEALSVLSEDAPSGENADEFVNSHTIEFRSLASRYLSLVNDIQFALRSHTHYLAQTASITSSANKTMPFKASIIGEQKELEIWTAALQTLRDRIEEIKQIGLSP